MDCAKRTSSVLGLKARPQIAIFFPRMIQSSSRREKSQPDFSAMRINACTSLGKQKPPKPSPGFKKDEPMRGSSPIPSATLVTSAPTASQRLATMLMKEIFIARNELDACLISSAELVSVTKNTGSPFPGHCAWMGQENFC